MSLEDVTDRRLDTDSCRTGRMQDKSDADKCSTVKDVGLAICTCRTSQIQDRMDAGQVR